LTNPASSRQGRHRDEHVTRSSAGGPAGTDAWTAPGVRKIIPRNTSASSGKREQHREQATGDGAQRLSDAEPHQVADAEVEIVTRHTYDVAEHRPERGAERGIGRPEAVEDSLAEVGVQVDPRDGARRDRLAENAGSRNSGSCGDPATDPPRCTRRSRGTARLERHVDERLRGAPGLDEAALGQRRECRRGRTVARRRCPVGALRDPACVHSGGRHAANSSAAVVVGRGRTTVRVKNTSSRLGSAGTAR